LAAVAPPRLIAIVGPTAAGKTELAMETALRLGGEIVSVDSRQVYRRLDVGTAKPDRAARRLVRHHLIDVVDPDEPYDAARYAVAARAAIDEILTRGRLAVLCGGSGLYLRALAEGLCPAPSADRSLRAGLYATIESFGAQALHDELRAVDPDLAARVSVRDVPRLVRGLEVARLTGRSLSSWQEEHRFRDRPYEILPFVLSPAVDELDVRIARRANAMWDAGLVEETAALLADGFAPGLPPLRSIGYEQAQLHLRGELGRVAAIAETVLATRRYAKRQRTWFRSLRGAVWLDDGGRGEVLSCAERFLAGDGDAPHVS
jgi:tRNA dimethylallyltransferase